MAITFQAYFLQCITNMHVGSGDANYGVVDKLVQRDPVTDHPTIHASSMKGALREHFEKVWKRDQKINDLFGKESEGQAESETGLYKFLGADLISLPIRCNFEQYVMALNGEIIEGINKKSKLLVGKEIFNTLDDCTRLYYKANQPSYELYAEDTVITNKEDYSNPLKVSGSLDCFEKKYAGFSNDDFTSISKNLPVIARNKIENGRSANLWYEQVVPHQSIFITYVGTTDDHLEEFEEVLLNDTIQIGANATIGYGLCKFHKIESLKTENL